MGAVLIVSLALFFIGFIFIALDKFNSDVTIINAGSGQVKTISATERTLIRNWMTENHIEIPEDVGFNYVVDQYPDRPWLDQ